MASMFPQKTLILLILLLNPSCAYGPTTKDKSMLAALNGKHYETAQVNAGPANIPIVKRRRASVQISGTVLIFDDKLPAPISNQIVDLWIGSQKVSSTRTEGNGSFKFLGDFPDGEATVKIETQKYIGERSFRIQGFELDHIDLNVIRKM
jgi:hypothetical protein